MKEKKERKNERKSEGLDWRRGAGSRAKECNEKVAVWGEGWKGAGGRYQDEKLVNEFQFQLSFEKSERYCYETVMIKKEKKEQGRKGT